MRRWVVFILAFLFLCPSISHGDEKHFFSNGDVSISEIFGDAFQRESNTDSFNWMTSNAEVQNSVTQNKKDLDAPNAIMKSKIDEEADTVRLRRQVLSQVGMEMGNSERAIYYPFGGADTQSPFLLQPTATDVFLQTADDFGSSDDISKLSGLEPFEKKGGYWSGFDSYRDLHIMQDENKIKGTGFAAVARLQRHLKAEILGIYPLEISQDGKLALQSFDKAASVKNALVVFRDPISGKLKRLWQFQHRIDDETSRFPKLAARLKFGTMMIKAAPSGMFEEEDLRKNALMISNDAAIRNRATVISDVRITNGGSGMHASHPQPLFKMNSELKLIKFNNQYGASYGYSSGGNGVVYLANYDALIDSSTPLSMVSSSATNLALANKRKSLAVNAESAKGIMGAAADVCWKIFEKLKFKR